MRVVIRADASVRIGTGHVMRCMALAARMRKRGADVTFVCREEAGNLVDAIAAYGFGTVRLPRSEQSGRTDGSDETTWGEEDAALMRRYLASRRGRADVVLVDHYMVGEHWEREMRSLARRVVVIDDLGNRRHDCDVLVDPNLHDSPETRYTGLVPAGSRVFVGPRYAPLREEFEAISPHVRTSGLRRLLVFMGGSDPPGEGVKVARALRAFEGKEPETIMIAGPINPRIAEIRLAAEGVPSLTVIESTNDMARLIEWADVGVGACGVAAWERCALGLPSLVAIIAANQRDDSRILHAIGAVRNLGDSSDTTVERWVEAIADLQRSPAEVQRMSIAAATVMEGWREAHRELERACLE